MPAHAVGVDEQLVLGHQQGQLQSIGPTLLHAAAGHDPLPAIGVQAIALGRAFEQGAKTGAQVGSLGETGGLIVDDQLAAVGVSDGIALGIEQHDFSVGGHDMLGQGCAEFSQGQVSAYDRVIAVAAGQRRADVMGGEKDIGLGGDLIVGTAGVGKPGSAAWIVSVTRVVLTAEQGQMLIEVQRL
ncbi:hypothetical protein D3C84_264850 [compost metagenome]